MNSKKAEEPESFDEFRSDLLADLDVIELVPENLWTIIRPTLYFSLPGIAFTILGYWLMTKDEATFWEYLLIVIGVFFLGCGILFAFVGLLQLPRDRTRYSFTNQGFTIKPKSRNKEFVSWKQMESLEIEGIKQDFKKRMKFTVRTSKEVYVIQARGYYEPSSKSRNTKKILQSILKYYERMK